MKKRPLKKCLKKARKSSTPIQISRSKVSSLPLAIESQLRKVAPPQTVKVFLNYIERIHIPLLKTYLYTIGYLNSNPPMQVSYLMKIKDYASSIILLAQLVEDSLLKKHPGIQGSTSSRYQDRVSSPH